MNPSFPANPNDPANRQDVVDRLNELLADRAVQPLDAAQAAELEGLSARLDLPPDDSIDHAAAVADMAFSPPTESLPAGLREKIIANGHLFARAARGETLGGVIAGQSALPVITAARPSQPSWQIWRGASAWTGWIAAAACLTVALWLNSELKRRGVEVFKNGLPIAKLISPVELYQRLMESGRNDLVVVDVAQASDEGDDREVEAQMVYDPELQTTLIKVKGLVANDPSNTRYQAWVQDASRDDALPVPAGFIDIPHTGATYVMRIDPKLPIMKPVGFALTREPPQGSVVSSPSRVIISGSIYNGPDVGPPPPEALDETPAINMIREAGDEPESTR